MTNVQLISLPCCTLQVILDRLYKIVHENVAAGGDLMQAAFELAYDYKRRRIERGYDTPIFNKTIFKKVIW